MKHWTGSYDYGTWQTRDPGICSWAMNRKGLVGRIEPGDTIICYVVKIGWTGLLRAKTTPRVDPESSPHGDAYPVVVDAEDLFVVEPEQAFAPSGLPRPEPTLRQGDGGEGPPIPMLFQGSGIQLSDEMGSALSGLIREWIESEPSPRKLTPRPAELLRTDAEGNDLAGRDRLDPCR